MILYVRDPRERRMADTAAAAVFLCASFVFGILVVRATVYGLLLIGALFCLVVYWVKPQMMVGVALFLSLAALPNGLHIGKVFGPVPVYAYHVALLLAVCYLLPVVRPHLSDFRLPAMFVLAVAFFTEVGLASGNVTERVVHETMYLLELVVGFALAFLIVSCDYIKGTINAVAVTLWFSAGMVVAGSMHAVELAGRSESMADMAGAVDADRVITTAQTPAIAVLTALVAAQILGRGRRATFLLLGPPAAIISMLTFARSTLLSIAVAAIVAIVTSMNWTTLRRTGKFLLAGAAIAVIALPGMLFLLQHSTAGAWLSTQITGYNNRVFGGVSTSALAVDESTLDRLREDAKLNAAIVEAPVFGHGLGYAYQAPVANGWFQLGTTYAHNFYLWWLCKAGAVGMAAFAVFVLDPVIRGLRSASTAAKIGAAVSAGLLVICNVDPLPEEPASALVLGMALGSVWAFVTRRQAREPRSRGETPLVRRLASADAG